MSVDIRLPSINGQDSKTQLEQIRRYLYGLAEQLNFALNNMEKGVDERVQILKEQARKPLTEEEAQNNFNSVKALIIKSADIVNAYKKVITEELNGLYVAESEFGSFKEETTVKIAKSSTDITTLFENTQTISSDVESVKAVISSDGDGTTILGSEAWVKVGLLEYDSKTGFPIYGMEIGQVNEQNGETVSRKFAQYRSDGVHLYDENGIKVALISQGLLHITKAEVEISLKLGGYLLDTTNGIAHKWVGRSDK
jgi:hypothetical protein